MAQRCRMNPTLSATPVAIAELPRWRWLICEAGYANVVPPAGLRVSAQEQGAAQVPQSGAEDTVYGVLYEMDEADERILDLYEGVDGGAEEEKEEKVSVSVTIRPREQGEGDYNKWYVQARVVRWLDDGHVLRESGEMVPVLVYVDEERVGVAEPKAEYIPRMNRAMREAEALGMSEKWLEEVLRQFIPAE